MPRFIHSILVVIAWLTLPLWGLAIGGEWFLSIRVFELVANLAPAATVAWAVLYMQDANSSLVKRHQDSWDAREEALIRTIELLAAGPEEEPKAVLTALHAVS